MENFNQHSEEMELTPEELAARKKEMLDFYVDSLPYLEAQLNYERKLFEIDEMRFKRTSLQVQLAMMMQGPREEEEETETPVKKKLKKE
jgi:hypothetical protein